MKKNEPAVMRSKLLILVLALFLLAGVGIGTTFAYLTSKSNSVINEFTPGVVTTEVMEEFDEEIKENVQIKNTGNIPAYIRAAVVINWVDVEGNILGIAPQSEVDYSIRFPEVSDWFILDGIYYFKDTVEPDQKTPILISSIEPNVIKEGYTLIVEILGSGIQSMPVKAVEEVWPVTVNPDNGELQARGDE